MSSWALVFLGIIAAATTVMAVLQIGAIIYVHRVGRRVEGIAAELQDEVRPLVGRLNAISGDAARAASLVVNQVERADRVVTECAQRLDETMSLVNEAVITPAREGLALIDGLRAGFAALKNAQEHQPPPTPRSADEDDALFIG